MEPRASRTIVRGARCYYVRLYGLTRDELGYISTPLTCWVTTTRTGGMMTPFERRGPEKAAADCGFERTPVLLSDGGLELRSAQFPEAVIMHIEADVFRVSATSSVLLDVANDSNVSVPDLAQLYVLLRQVSAIARTVPNRVADRFCREKQRLPQTTEAGRWALGGPTGWTGLISKCPS